MLIVLLRALLEEEPVCRNSPGFSSAVFKPTAPVHIGPEWAVVDPAHAYDTLYHDCDPRLAAASISASPPAVPVRVSDTNAGAWKSPTGTASA